MNLIFEFRVSIFERFVGEITDGSSLDHTIERFLMLAVDSKAFALFSILFGVGLAIQFERLAGNRRRAVLLVRRLAVLLAIGLLHLLLIWNGDILTEYALAGFIALPFLWGPRWLTAAGAMLFLALFVTAPPVLLLPDAAWLRGHIAEANRIYGMGGFQDIAAFRIRELEAIVPLHVGIFPRTVALFLFGLFIWRAGILCRAAGSKDIWFTVGALGILVGLVSTLVGGPIVGLLAPVILASGYGAIIVGMMTTSGGRKLFGWAVPLGRMAFTNYLVQSIIFGWVFYGYGLGLFGRLGVATTLSVGIAVYGVQAIVSEWWLKNHRFGPLEWLWRTLMYGAPQAMSILSANR